LPTCANGRRRSPPKQNEEKANTFDKTTSHEESLSDEALVSEEEGRTEGVRLGDPES
jgi:hypothetical protein